MKKNLGAWLEEPTDPREIEVQTACDFIFRKSTYEKTFAPEHCEVDGELCRYFDGEGNMLIINSETDEITFVHYKNVEIT